MDDTKKEKKLRILVADDNMAFLRELTSLLAVDFDVVATASDGRSALNLIHLHQPHVVVVDLGMPNVNGIEIAKELARNSSRPPVVICSVETDSEVLKAAEEAGALGYVFKGCVNRDLVLAVKSAHKGKAFTSHL